MIKTQVKRNRKNYKFELSEINMLLRKKKENQRMINIKTITLFQHNQNFPFMTHVVKDIEENEQGMKLILENGNNIYVKDYDFFFLSESVDGCDKQRIVNAYRRLYLNLAKLARKQ